LAVLTKALFGLAATVLVTTVSWDAFACTPPPPPPPWMTVAEIEAEWKQRVLDSQTDDWNRAASVFIARVESQGTVAFASDSRGRRAVLVPVLQIKGPDVRRAVRIQHTGSLCGMTPDLDALDENARGYFMVYALDEAPSGRSVYVTAPLGELVDPGVLAAWRAAYADTFDQ
jgi:hypothetical protein